MFLAVSEGLFGTWVVGSKLNSFPKETSALSKESVTI
jgi:hypothetical protein